MLSVGTDLLNLRNLREPHAVRGAFCSICVICVRKHSVEVDNFALRSVSGMHLQHIDEQKLRDVDQVRDYDLVVLMYALNVAKLWPKCNNLTKITPQCIAEFKKRRTFVPS